MLGAAIVLPDHPQIAPESRGNLFDNTEIEEALVLHVQALSDDERAEIEHQDPAVREMIDRACAVTPEELLKLHGAWRCATGHARAAAALGATCATPRAGCPRSRWTAWCSAAAARSWSARASRPTCRRGCSRAGQ